MNILLHICCGPCAILPVRTLRSEGRTVTGFFFNHNIHPYQEYRKRLDTVTAFAQQEELPAIIRDEYRLEEFLAAVAANPAERCRYCYASRLEETAKAAAEGGFAAWRIDASKRVELPFVVIQAHYMGRVVTRLRRAGADCAWVPVPQEP